MNILLSNTTSQPIYEQIASQLRGAILSGELQPGALLPSIRALAKDLRVSVITTKRAYEELEKDGFLNTVPGKGCYVSQNNAQRIREAHLSQIEGHLEQAISLAALCELSREELTAMLHALYDEP